MTKEEKRDAPRSPAVWVYRLTRHPRVTTTTNTTAFLARELRCVDADLFGRIASNQDPALSRFIAFNQTTRPVGFWTGADGLAKYLRIGQPAVVALNMPSNNVGFKVQNFSSADWAGLQEYKNGQNLISGVGYSAADWCVCFCVCVCACGRERREC